MKYLLLDSSLIEEVENCKLTMGLIKKHPNNPLFGEEKPWEVRFDNLYPNVYFDPEKNKFVCWYNPFIIDKVTTETPVEHQEIGDYARKLIHIRKPREMGLCYAESEDGLQWQKPDLNIIEYNGLKTNNIIQREVHGAGILADWNPNNDNSKFRMCYITDKPLNMMLAESDDGINWINHNRCSQIEKVGKKSRKYKALWRGDTHNNFIWCSSLKKYVLITRLWGLSRQNRKYLKNYLKKNKKLKYIRLVGRSESEDLVDWSNSEVILEGKDPSHQIYSMPIFEYGNIFLGLPAIFVTTIDRVYTALAWSPDTTHWNLVEDGKPFIPNSKKEGAYDWGCIYAAVQPIIRGGEVLIYYGGSDGLHTDWRKGYLCLAKLRLDGFAGYQSTYVDTFGTILTKPIKKIGSNMTISADIEEKGTLKISILDIKNHILSDSEEIKKSCTDEIIVWNDNINFKNLISDQIKLCFEFTNATVYSFSFIK